MQPSHHLTVALSTKPVRAGDSAALQKHGGCTGAHDKLPRVVSSGLLGQRNNLIHKLGWHAGVPRCHSWQATFDPDSICAVG